MDKKLAGKLCKEVRVHAGHLVYNFFFFHIFFISSLSENMENTRVLISGKTLLSI